MPELTDDDIKRIRETHDEVIRITTILGDGDKGICHDVRSTQRRVNRLELIIVGFLGTGTLGGGILSLIKWWGG